MINEQIKLLIADDHTMIIDGIKALLRREKQFEFIGEVSNGLEAIRCMGEQTPDILITDLSMPEMNGSELIKWVKENKPEVKVLVLSMHHEPEIIRDIMILEAEGYVLKNTSREELTNALKKLADGGTHYSDAVVSSLLKAQKSELRKDAEVVSLTPREIEIIQLIVQEYTNEEMAEMLFLSKRTVETHRKNINQKTNIKTVVGLIKFALRNELVRMDDFRS